MELALRGFNVSNVLLRSDWLPERARWILPARDFPLCSRKAKFFGVIFWPYNKSFTNQACSVMMAAGYWPLFLRFYGPRLCFGL